MEKLYNISATFSKPPASSDSLRLEFLKTYKLPINEIQEKLKEAIDLIGTKEAIYKEDFALLIYFNKSLYIKFKKNFATYEVK